MRCVCIFDIGGHDGGHIHWDRPFGRILRFVLHHRMHERLLLVDLWHELIRIRMICDVVGWLEGSIVHMR